MAVENISQFLVTESGRLNYDIYQRTQYSSPWITLPRKVAWPEGMGEVISNIMWERPFTADPRVAWADMVANDAIPGNSNSCIPPVDLVEFTQTKREMKLQHKAIESLPFCVTDLIYTAKREVQMQMVEKGLADQVRLEWIEFNREGFETYANKYVLESGLSFTDEGDGLTWPGEVATSRLTNEALDYFYNLLILEQGTQHALSTQNGRPVFGLITDMNTSRFLIRGDETIREDFHYGAPDQLLKPLGVSHTYNGYVHMIDDAPPRYNWNGGTSEYERVEHYVVDGVGAARKKIVNPLWLAAEYQVSYIYVKDAYQLRVPGSINSVSKAKFNPQNYMADFKFMNVVNVEPGNVKYNPDGKIGYFRGVMASGYEPKNPHVMYAIMHKVCPLTIGAIACPA